MKAIIGKKVGMSQIFDENGHVIPVTVIEAGPCTVVQKKTSEKEGYNAVQLGFEDVAEKKLTKGEMGHLNKAGVSPKKHLREFDLDNAAELNIGDIVKADTFAAGDFVDITGISKGHGYQGVIKRWGAQRTPTSQWTVTGGGAVVVAGAAAQTPDQAGPWIQAAAIGTIEDKGIKDAANMGAAMAPAAAATILGFLSDTGTTPEDYDLILTGDLGQVGSDLLYELAIREGVDLRSRHTDCGLLIYDRDRQDVHAGGSGCGCCASVLCSYILPSLREGRVKRVLFAATGALLSPTSTQQGESIPSIAHAVCLTSRKEDLPWN